MPNVFLALTDVVNFGNRYTLESGDFLFVDDLAVIGSLDLATVIGIGTRASAMIAGDVVSIVETASALSFDSAPETTVNLASTGSVWGAAGPTVATVQGGTAFRLFSQGSIQSPFGIAVAMSGSGGSVENHGAISGGSNGILLNGPDQTVLNYGTIAGGTTAGPNSTFGHAVQVSANGALVSNFGSMTAAAVGGSVVNVAGGGGPSLSTVRIENHGTMTSARGTAIDVSENIGIGVVLVNSGTISGATGAFLGSNGGSTVINSGTLIGSVTFGSGADVYDGRGRSIAERVFGGSGNDTLSGGINSDYLAGDSNVDSLSGSAGDDSLFGGQSFDVLRGGPDDDILYGGTHGDSLYGGAGDDTLLGETDLDVLFGGTGNDTFRFVLATHSAVGTSRDRIVDFQTADDVIDLFGFLAAGTFIGEAAFTNVAKQVRYTATTGIVAADIDGNGTVDFEIRLNNRPAVLTEDNFLF